MALTMADVCGARGEDRGYRNAILETLEERFGSIPTEVKARLDAATASELRQWRGLAMRAASLQEVIDFRSTSSE